MKTKTIESRADSKPFFPSLEELHDRIPYELQCLVPASRQQLRTALLVGGIFIPLCIGVTPFMLLSIYCGAKLLKEKKGSQL